MGDASGMFSADEMAHEMNNQDNAAFDEPPANTTFRGPSSPGYGGGYDWSHNDVQSLHDHMDELDEQKDEEEATPSQQNQGGVQDRNSAFGQGQMGGPQARGTQRSGDDILAGYHAQTLAMTQHAAEVHAQVSGAQASMRQRAANWSAKTPQGVQSTGSGIGASAAQNEQTMAGLLPVQNGASNSTDSNKRFRN